MKLVPWLAAVIRADIPVQELEPFRVAGSDAYELVEQLPRGPARLAAWNAYVFQNYADRLIGANEQSDHVRPDTAQLARDLYALVGAWLARARRIDARPGDVTEADLTEAMPHWHTPVRSHDQLVGMRETLDVLRTYLAFDLEQLRPAGPLAERLRSMLELVDAKLDVEGLWIARPPAELRGRIGDLLAGGLETAYAMGRLLADPKPLPTWERTSIA